MLLRKPHFSFYTSNSPAVTWTRSCGCREQAVTRDTKLLETLAKWSWICRLLCLCQNAGRSGWFLFLRESTWAQLGGGWRPLAAVVLLRSSLLAGSGSSKPRSSEMSWLVWSALPLSISLLLQQDPCSAEPGPSFLGGRLGSHPLLLSTEVAVTCSAPAPAPGPALICQGWCRSLGTPDLLCGGLLPPWADAGPSPLLQSPLCPRYSPGVLLVAAHQPFFITWQGQPPRWSLVVVEGGWWVLNCQKMIKSSWVDILDRTFVAFVNL